MPDPSKPLVLITGAAGNIGRSLAAALAADYRIVGIDRGGAAGVGGGGGPDFPILDVDLTRQHSIDEGLARLRAERGARIASVIHLIA